MISRSTSALLIVGHGSTVNPDSSAPTLRHAAEIRRREVFSDVACCFWKEEPSLRDALLFFRDEAIREVYVVPNFISEGYFTRTVIPRELELTGPETRRTGGQIWKYCEPVGNHGRMTELLLQRAQEVAPGTSEAETSLLIVGHGTSLNDNSAVAAKRQADMIRALHRYAAVLNVYMEEPPLVSDWLKLTETPNVVVVPFFISDGLHSDEDIPVLLGINDAVRAAGEGGKSGNPHQLHGRSLFYSTAIGTDPKFADVIIEQTESFRAPAQEVQSLS
ncbi:MAG: sirohydrochlorin cobaltochelatase [Verrucomicrobiota bacterium]|jgi:sirohydrochlorin cobaltochelatase